MKRRLMKGQLPLDYMIALLFFVLFVAFIFIQTRAYTPTYLRELRLQRMRVEAYQISEMLVNDVGEPGKRLGLAANPTQTNNLSKSKVMNLNTTCATQPPNGYFATKNLIDTDYEFKLLIKNESAVLVNCSSPQEPSDMAVDITRIVYFDDDSYGELILQIW